MTNTATAPAATVHVRINRAATVHTAWTYEGGRVGSTTCASEGRNGRAPYYKVTTEDVTCRKCLAAKS